MKDMEKLLRKIDEEILKKNEELLAQANREDDIIEKQNLYRIAQGLLMADTIILNELIKM